MIIFCCFFSRKFSFVIFFVSIRISRMWCHKKNCDFFHLNNKKEKKPPNVNYVLLVDVPIRRYDLAVRSGEKHFCLQGHQTALFSNLVFFFSTQRCDPAKPVEMWSMIHGWSMSDVPKCSVTLKISLTSRGHLSSNACEKIEF